MNTTQLTALRKLARLPTKAAERTPLCLYVAGIQVTAPEGSSTRRQVAALLRKHLSEREVDERHFVASSLYSLLIGSRRRRELAAFFTPPHIVRHTIDAAIRAGLDLKKHRIIDPAAGGAAFLSSLAGRMRDLGVPASDALRRLSGVELDSGLADLAERLICDRFSIRSGKGVVRCGDALDLWDCKASQRADAVLANPPYGRITGKATSKTVRFRDVVSPGHVNRYAIFAGLSIRLVKPGGVVALVIPASFLTGSLFGPLRRYIRTNCEISSLDIIEERDRTFLDVSQDACILTVTKKRSHRAIAGSPECAVISTTGERCSLAPLHLPASLDAPWVVPGKSGRTSDEGLVTLEAYGLEARAGYFVWNREQGRMRTGHRSGCVPLVWARNVQAGRKCVPAGRNGPAPDFVYFPNESNAIVREPAIVLQRTTNSRQPRRIIAAIIDDSVLKQYGGFVSENHTIVLRSTGPGARLDLALALLGTDAVDTRFRRISTGSHVPVTAIRALLLPPPATFEKALAKAMDAERAAVRAFQPAEKPGVVSVQSGEAGRGS